MVASPGNQESIECADAYFAYQNVIPFLEDVIDSRVMIQQAWWMMQNFQLQILLFRECHFYDGWPDVGLP